MNIKNIRRNYDGLTMLERLSLADNAISRGDESEITAIIEASPKESFRQVDYYDLLKEITTFRLCNLIVRLGYIMTFDYFCLQAELDILNNKSSSDDERVRNGAKMAAYLYCRATDSWTAVNDELGLRPNFDEQMSKFLFALEMMKSKEEIIRKLAFTEDEVKKYLEETSAL
jgi:hypothetical protein